VENTGQKNFPEDHITAKRKLKVKRERTIRILQKAFLAENLAELNKWYDGGL